MNKEFVPKFFSLLKQGISKETLTKDLLSGLIVGISDSLNKDFEKHGMGKLIKDEFVVRNIEKALEKAKEIINHKT
jgi:hypothetical protein